LHNGERRLRLPLPTYPFERKRFWLEMVPEAIGGEDPTSSAGASGSDRTVRNLQPTQETEVANMAPNNGSQSALTSLSARSSKIQTAIAELLRELSGVDVASVDSSITFLELGFDSLFLTQLAQAVQEKFAIKITFRQLLNDVSSLAALTNYVQGELAPDAFCEPPSTPKRPDETGTVTAIAAASVAAQESRPASAAPGAPSSLAGDAVGQLMRDQLQAMNQLLAKQLETMQVAVSQVNCSSAASPAGSAGYRCPGDHPVGCRQGSRSIQAAADWGVPGFDGNAKESA
jgi:acyl carrier protein